MDPSYTGSLPHYQMDRRETSPAQRVPSPSLIAFFMRYYIIDEIMKRDYCFWACFWCSIVLFWCSRTKHTISLIWFVGEAIRCMTVLRSSGFSGWTLSSQKLLLVILHLHIINIDSVLSLYMNALSRVSKQHTRVAHLMSKMACCSTTSKFLIPFFEYVIANHMSTYLFNFLYHVFTRFCFSLSGLLSIKLEPLPLHWYGKMQLVANMLLIQTAREKYQMSSTYVSLHYIFIHVISNKVGYGTSINQNFLEIRLSKKLYIFIIILKNKK